MKSVVREESTSLEIHTAKVVSKDLPVFYNPAMKFNRDISILLLQALKRKSLSIADPLVGSGVRTIRFLKELPKSLIGHVYCNDGSAEAVKLINNHLKLNNVKENITVTCCDANEFLLQSKGFDYIDIDPFGSPNPFLDQAVKKIAREGILAVTATDTAPLCGTYPAACKRKYWATPKKGPAMHEYGLRILIRKVQLVAAQYDKALIPIFSYAKDHYMRVFLLCKKGKTHVDQLLKQHDVVNEVGPLWTGPLWESKLAKAMKAKTKDPSTKKFMDLICQESTISSFPYIDLHAFCKGHSFSSLPKHEDVMNQLKKKGRKASRTHFTGEGMRTNATEKELKEIIKRLIQQRVSRQ